MRKPVSLSYKMILLVRKYLLLPITVLWAGVLKFRHLLYDKNILSVYSPEVKSICVGNLAFGGTGKTPFVEYLISEKLEEGYKGIAVISRGYGRESKDLTFVRGEHNVHQVGDEPLQIKRKFNRNVTVVVCADRKEATEKLLLEKPFTDLIIYDDAFQHRKIKASTNILLTTYDKPFWNDDLFPSGSLRDVKNRVVAAHEIVITKCPAILSDDDKKTIKRKLPKRKEILFSSIKYQKAKGVFTDDIKDLNSFSNILLITGIANSTSLTNFLKAHNINFQHLKFSDHHNFSMNDLNKISSEFKKLPSNNNVVLTTEKDAIRLYFFQKEIETLALEIYYLPICFKMI